ncbi:TetR/AcrR family transcriptional regulator [Arthrobacter sp. MMS18-M83]|uniref:TetR/AcrR family transcriptional regulator n=1 Tax=Arthrobacter sp. MMS18-M83 TaxID=2996261 RepID=UPI00227A637E|nr:helix-turn-helix domain-containing protein [Arthrobacter sp. MMS18-M83]WAH97679.1 helix-turn-helix domain containing protein [Arthrobacter sp. MMS18-M83]
MRVNDAPFPVRAAVDRALAKQTQEATRDVESILDAALRVAQRCAPEAPRVADIVAEAGISNQAFYRYFAGKDELLNAVFERGIQRLHTYLVHQMEKESDPREQITAWIRGILTQVTDQTAAHQSAAVVRQINRGGQPDNGSGPLTALGGMLVDPIRQAGSREPELDAQVILEAVTGTLRRHLSALTAPDQAESAHIVAFCLRGLAV